MSALDEMVAAAAPLLGVEPDAAGAEAKPVTERVGNPDRAFTLEAVREGYLLHYAEPRALAVDDADLALLGGDTLYALGLARIADAGDLDAVAELADLISLCAAAHAEGRPELAAEVWRASAAALGGDGPGARASFTGLAQER